MKPMAAEIRPSVDLIKLRHSWDSACGKEHRAEKTLAETRLEKGRILVEARKAFPARGPKAKGWGELLEQWGIGDDTARNYMKLAGYVEDLPNTSGNSIPTYAEAGIAPKKEYEHWTCPGCQHEWDTRRETCQNCYQYNSDGSRSAEQESPSDEQRDAAYQREVEASLPPRIETREVRTHEFVEACATARASILRIVERNVHLTDVTTSPEDFMRAKQILIDIVNRCLEELDAAGVLDGKERRRQMALLKGGLE